MNDGVLRGASFSGCRMYRYSLTRVWRPVAGEIVAFVGLNPSTADETLDDPTIRRCMGFARSWGAGGMVMLNAFAYRATDPEAMKAHPQPVGPLNDEYLAQWTRSATIVVACWGVHGAHHDRGDYVRKLITSVRPERSPLQVFGLTKHGHPKHPLYLSKTTQLEEWT